MIKYMDYPKKKEFKNKLKIDDIKKCIMYYPEVLLSIIECTYFRDDAVKLEFALIPA